MHIEHIILGGVAVYADYELTVSWVSPRLIGSGEKDLSACVKELSSAVNGMVASSEQVVSYNALTQKTDEGAHFNYCDEIPPTLQTCWRDVCANIKCDSSVDETDEYIQLNFTVEADDMKLFELTYYDGDLENLILDQSFRASIKKIVLGVFFHIWISTKFLDSVSGGPEAYEKLVCDHVTKALKRRINRDFVCKDFNILGKYFNAQYKLEIFSDCGTNLDSEQMWYCTSSINWSRMHLLSSSIGENCKRNQSVFLYVGHPYGGVGTEEDYCSTALRVPRFCVNTFCGTAHCTAHPNHSYVIRQAIIELNGSGIKEAKINLQNGNVHEFFPGKLSEVFQGVYKWSPIGGNKLKLNIWAGEDLLSEANKTSSAEKKIICDEVIASFKRWKASNLDFGEVEMLGQYTGAIYQLKFTFIHPVLLDAGSIRGCVGEKFGENGVLLKVEGET